MLIPGNPGFKKIAVLIRRKGANPLGDQPSTKFILTKGV